MRTCGCDSGMRPKEMDLTDTRDGCGGFRGEQRLSMDFMGRKKLMGNGSKSNLGHVEFEDIWEETPSCSWS